MNRFDLVFEKALYALNEREYVAPTFEDNVGALIKMLNTNDFLPKNTDVKALTKQVMAQPKHVKEIVLDTGEESLPAMKLQVAGDTDPESLTVTVIELSKPDEPREFTNSMRETLFDDVISYIKTASLKSISSEAAVDTLPEEENPAASQPGAEKSALPGVQ